MDFSRRSASVKRSTMSALAIFLLGFGCHALLFNYLSSENLRTLSISAGDVPIAIQEKLDEEIQVTCSRANAALPPGWKQISVFYGNLSLLPTPSGMWPSQSQQDTIVAELFHNKRKGYFVDLAANDAYTLSNTYGLEKELDWQGLCIEANPRYWRNLSFRNCHVAAAVVGTARMEKVQFNLQGVLGGIVGDGFDNSEEAAKHPTPFFTTTLKEIFALYQTPILIDYMSLDVEGAESYILSSFPFRQYTFKALTIERPTLELCKLLYTHGYELARVISEYGEMLWIHAAHKHELNMDVIDKLEDVGWTPRHVEACRATAL